MDRQQALMPEIEALKKKYGNKQKVQQNQNLYCRYNINPMMGCLAASSSVYFPILMALVCNRAQCGRLIFQRRRTKFFLGIFDLEYHAAVADDGK